MATRTITLSASSWTQSVSRLYYDSVANKFFTDSSLTDEVTSIPLPTRETYRFDGFWNSSSSTATSCWINPDGSINPAWSPTASVTVYVHQTRVSYKITINDYGGIGGDAAIYYGILAEGFYSDDLCAHPADRVSSLPEKVGHSFAGYWSATSGGVERIGTDGVIVDGWKPTANATVYARYNANVYTLSFDYGPGTGSISSKQVTFGSAVGNLPTATYSRGSFEGWMVGGAKIGSSTVWNVAHDETATASYEPYFGRVTDYFGIGSDTLIPISSDGGENRQHVVSYNAPSETPATETSGIWMNPRVTYEVAGNTTLDVTIGKGFAGQVYNSGSTHRVDVTGYMIASVEIHAAIGEPVRVTVSAVANEGFTRSGSETMTAAATDAIKTYRIVANLSPRHRPQDVMNALSLNGFDLQEITTVATCDPVVIAENGAPCASDICHGRIEVNARMADYGDGVSFAANSGWTIVGEPVSNDGVGYRSVSVNARKELT